MFATVQLQDPLLRGHGLHHLCPLKSEQLAPNQFCRFNEEQRRNRDRDHRHLHQSNLRRPQPEGKNKCA